MILIEIVIVKENAAGHDTEPVFLRWSHMKATSILQVENERVIVTEWRFAPGADTGYHVHGHDYVVVPLTSGTLRLEEPAGVRDAHLKAGASYARPAGVAHNVINVNDFEFRFVEIELKEPPAA
jgi:beta-alanine degradation protein BauB